MNRRVQCLAMRTRDMRRPAMLAFLTSTVCTHEHQSPTSLLAEHTLCAACCTQALDSTLPWPGMLTSHAHSSPCIPHVYKHVRAAHSSFAGNCLRHGQPVVTKWPDPSGRSLEEYSPLRDQQPPCTTTIHASDETSMHKTRFSLVASKREET